MIVDSWKNFSRYAALAPEAWKLIADFMANKMSAELPAASYELKGGLLKANVMDVKTKPASDGCLEIHHQFIDIQANIAGDEMTYCRGIEGLVARDAFNDADDYQLFDQNLTNGVATHLDGSNFVIFFPNEAHSGGLIPEGSVSASFKKVVFKIDISLLNK